MPPWAGGPRCIAKVDERANKRWSSAVSASILSSRFPLCVLDLASFDETIAPMAVGRLGVQSHPQLQAQPELSESLSLGGGGIVAHPCTPSTWEVEAAGSSLGSDCEASLTYVRPRGTNQIKDPRVLRLDKTDWKNRGLTSDQIQKFQVSWTVDTGLTRARCCCLVSAKPSTCHVNSYGRRMFPFYNCDYWKEWP